MFFKPFPSLLVSWAPGLLVVAVAVDVAVPVAEQKVAPPLAAVFSSIHILSSATSAYTP